MKEYSDEMLRKIEKEVRELHLKFTQDELSQALTSEQREESGFITEVFAELMYSYHLQGPREWRVTALEEICLDVMPRKVSAGDEFYANVQPVLTAFFDFLQQQGVISNAGTLSNKLKKVAPAMVKLAANPADWGMAKAMLMEGIKSGALDNSSEENLQKTMGTYIETLNQMNAENVKPVEKKVGRNDPCPCGSGKKYKKCCGNGKVIEFPAIANRPDGKPIPQIYQIKVTIIHIEPAIWRRLLVPSGITFNKLHKIIQAAFGWQDYHQYNFDFGDTVVDIPDPDYPMENVINLNAKREKIDNLLTARKKCVYTYDFGDDWEHEIILEEIKHAEEGVKYPICLEGAMHRPPEDVGGEPGYMEFLKAINDPTHCEHECLIEWAEKDTNGRKFLPDYFYLKEVNRALARIR